MREGGQPEEISSKSDDEQDDKREQSHGEEGSHIITASRLSFYDEIFLTAAAHEIGSSLTEGVRSSMRHAALCFFMRHEDNSTHASLSSNDVRECVVKAFDDNLPKSFIDKALRLRIARRIANTFLRKHVNSFGGALNS